MLPKIDLIYFDAGGGHRASANALKTALEPKWKVKLINLREVLGEIDFIKKYIGISIENLYNIYCKLGYTVGSKFMLQLLQRIIRMKNSKIIQQVDTYWKNSDTDIVVSLIPNFNKSLFEAIKKPYVTIMLDMEECSSHFWLEQQDQHVIVGTYKAFEQASKILPNNKIHLVSGLIVHPDFYNQILYPPNKCTTALVCFGGYGSNKMIKIAKALHKAQLDISVKYVCGFNKKLYKRIEALNYPQTTTVHKFVSNLPQLMRQSDFLIGKPGPGVISEALVCDLPVALDNSAPMIQERYNLEWVEENSLGAGFDLCDTWKMEHFINMLPFYKRHVRGTNNQAVFQIPTILERLI